MDGSKASLDRTSRGADLDKRQGSSIDISSSNSDDSSKRTRHNVRSVTSKDAQLESTKAEMGEVRKENERLRMNLDKMIKEYQELQKQFQIKVVENETIQSLTKTDPHGECEEEDDELVSLSLGRTSSMEVKHQGMISKGNKDGLDLGLGDYNYNYNQKLSERTKTEDALANVLPLPGLENITSSAEEDLAVEGSSWPPQKVLKRREFENGEPSHPSSSGKRARVCLRIRCETPTMNDGCQWRKYGQKIAKGNPCPRAYYRCTVAPACPVRKQVQRCAEDMSILIITYEGTHNHPLPISATNMTSTTSAAAASTLLYGQTNSNTSRPTLDGLRCYASNGFSNKHNNNTIQQQYQLPTNHYSSSNPNPNPNHKTITLDHFSVFPRSNHLNQSSSRPTSLSFSSSSSQWGNSSNNMSCYSSSNQFTTSPMDQNSFYQSSMQRSSNNNVDSKTMTAAITSDPTFQSALAAAISTIIGSRVDNGQLQGMISGLEPAGNSTNPGLAGNNFMHRQPAQTVAVVPIKSSTSTSPGVSIEEN